MAALGTNNISVSLVKNTLGESTYSVFLLATSALINMWSRFKPTRGVNNGELTLNNNTFWKGSDGRCGFNLPIWSSGIIYSPTTWGYLQPRGGSYGGTPDEPGRLGDFRGYFHDNTLAPPFYSNQSDNIVRTLDPVENELVS
jgi:hypothetical protein